MSAVVDYWKSAGKWKWLVVFAIFLVIVLSAMKGCPTGPVPTP